MLRTFFMVMYIPVCMCIHVCIHTNTHAVWSVSLLCLGDLSLIYVTSNLHDLVYMQSIHRQYDV